MSRTDGTNQDGDSSQNRPDTQGMESTVDRSTIPGSRWLLEDLLSRHWEPRDEAQSLGSCRLCKKDTEGKEWLYIKNQVGGCYSVDQETVSLCPSVSPGQWCLLTVVCRDGRIHRTSAWSRRLYASMGAIPEEGGLSQDLWPMMVSVQCASVWMRVSFEAASCIMCDG